MQKPETIDITPDYEGVRRWLLERVFPGSPADIKHGLRVAAELENEAPSIREIAEACGAMDDALPDIIDKPRS